MKKLNNYKPHSSYWLNDWTLNPVIINGMTQLQKQTHDIYQLAAAKRAISNFVSIVTNKVIPVIFSTEGSSYTTGKKVVIGADIIKPLDFDVAVGLALHEGSHIKLSNFNLFKQFANLIPASVYDAAIAKGITNTDNIVKNIWNWVEDRRIDNFIYNEAPGYRGYYTAMYDKYFNSPIIDKGLTSTSCTDETVDSYMFRIIDLQNISRLKNTKATLNVAIEIFKVMLKYIDNSLQSKENSKNSKESNKKDGEGNKNGEDGSQTGGEGSQTGGEGNQNEKPKTLSDDEFNDLLNSTDSPKSFNNSKGNSTPIKLTPSQAKLLAEKIKEQNKFIDGSVDKTQISFSLNKDINNVETSGSEMKAVGQDLSAHGNTDGVKCVVVKKLTTNLLNSRVFPLSKTRNAQVISYYKSEVDKGIQIGTMLAKKLQVRSESRTIVFNRQKIGKIDKRMIASLGFGNENVFEFKDVDSYNKANIHVSIDASGSMDGTKWRKTITNIVAMCKAIDMIPGLDIQVTFRTSTNYKPYIVMAYNSKVDKFAKVVQMFPCLVPYGTTPEGLCYEAIMKEFLASTASFDSYFINISDGEPYFNTPNLKYSGTMAANHTKKMFKKIQSMGIKSLSYFVHSSRSKKEPSYTFKTMYGKTAKSIAITNVSEIAKTVNKLFMEKHKK